MGRPRSALGMLLILLGLWASQAPWIEASVDSAGSGTEWRAEELNWYGISQRRLNDTRTDAGLSLLAADGYLWGLSHERARDMAARGYLSSTTPEGIDSGGYMQQDGARYARWTELQADDATGRSEEEVAWEIIGRFLNDDGSRTAILADFDRFGVALAEVDGRRVFVVLLAKHDPPPTPVPTAVPAPAPAPPPPPPAPAAGSVEEIIRGAARRHGVEPDWLVRTARCESKLNPRAYNPAGPYIGLFQFHPNTFYSYGGRDKDIYSAADQSEVAARMFARGLSSHWPHCSRR